MLEVLKEQVDVLEQELDDTKLALALERAANNTIQAQSDAVGAMLNDHSEKLAEIIGVMTSVKNETDTTAAEVFLAGFDLNDPLMNSLIAPATPTKNCTGSAPMQLSQADLGHVPMDLIPKEPVVMPPSALRYMDNEFSETKPEFSTGE